MAFALFGPFQNQFQSWLLTWVFVKHAINQTVPVGSGFNTSCFVFFLITELLVGMASQFHIRRSEMAIYGRFPDT